MARRESPAEKARRTKAYRLWLEKAKEQREARLAVRLEKRKQVEEAKRRQIELALEREAEQQAEEAAHLAELFAIAEAEGRVCCRDDGTELFAALVELIPPSLPCRLYPSPYPRRRLKQNRPTFVENVADRWEDIRDAIYTGLDDPEVA